MGNFDLIDDLFQLAEKRSELCESQLNTKASAKLVNETNDTIGRLTQIQSVLKEYGVTKEVILMADEHNEFVEMGIISSVEALDDLDEAGKIEITEALEGVISKALKALKGRIVNFINKLKDKIKADNEKNASVRKVSLNNIERLKKIVSFDVVKMQGKSIDLFSNDPRSTRRFFDTTLNKLLFKDCVSVLKSLSVQTTKTKNDVSPKFERTKEMLSLISNIKKEKTTIEKLLQVKLESGKNKRDGLEWLAIIYSERDGFDLSKSIYNTPEACIHELESFLSLPVVKDMQKRYERYNSELVALYIDVNDKVGDVLNSESEEADAVKMAFFNGISDEAWSVEVIFGELTDLINGFHYAINKITTTAISCKQ